MIKSFYESYNHLKAKEVLYDWLTQNPDGRRLPKTSKRGVAPFIFQGSVFMEYPIVVNHRTNSIIVPWYNNKYYIERLETVDCLDGVPHPERYKKSNSKYTLIKKYSLTKIPPTYDQCVFMNDYPFAVIDVVICNEQGVIGGFEVVHKSPVSADKRAKLYSVGLTNVVEISSNWILGQIRRPNNLVYNEI